MATTVEKVTISEYLAFMGIPAVTNETQVTAAILDAIAYAEGLLGYSLVVHDSGSPVSHTQDFIGTGGRQFYPKNGPVQSATSAALWDGDSYELVDTATHTIVTDGNKITFEEGYVWSKSSISDQENWRVIYVYGFTDELPRQLKRGILMAAQAFANVSAISAADIKSQSDGEQTITYRDTPDVAVPADAQSLIMRYSRYSTI